MKVKLVKPLLVSFLCLFVTTSLAARSEPVDGGHYTTKDSEFYLSPEQLLFIRPGLVLTITEVIIPADRQTEVTFTLTDPAGLPLDRTGVVTPGPVSTSFILSFIPSFEESYVAYTTRVQTSPITGDSAIQATTDAGGTYTELSTGTYRYKFGTTLPENYDIDATHTLGVYARRDLTEFELDRYVANEVDHFVPSGMAEPMPRDIVTTETCNGRCHDPLAIHGGSRQKVELCILCHNARQDIDPDTGNSIDMPLMIHKIHMGENLSEDYTIIGYRQSVHNYNDVVYPAPINECTDCHTGGIPTENFPLVSDPAAALVCDGSGHGSVVLNWQYTDNVEIIVRSASNPEGSLFATGGPSGSAETGKWVSDGMFFDLHDAITGQLIQSVPVNNTVLGCVSNAPGTFRGEAGTQHSNWMDNPSRKTCGSCHDYVNWETGEGHSEYNLVMVDDITCDHCHVANSGDEFDRSVTGAHLELYKSAQFPGVLVNFLEVSNTNPGDRPTVKFSVATKYGPIDPAILDRFRLSLSGPNDDYSFRIQEIANISHIWAGDNTWTYTFGQALPEDAAGSFTVSVEARNLVPIDFDGTVSEERDNAENPSIVFAVTDKVATARRMVVDDYNCESCHSNLSFHGGTRHDPQYCNTCHMPEALDFDGDQTIHLKYMIHAIHRGEQLENGFSIGDQDYSDVVYPGDLRNCETCHVNNSQQVPVSSTSLPTTTPQAWWSPMAPNTAACLSCHDDEDAAAHAYSNTTFFGESCGTCHGEGRVASVDKVHAQ
jgi:hypothetical protein